MTAFVDGHTVENLLTIGEAAYVPQSTPTSTNGTLTLGLVSNSLQVITGSASGFSVVLPSALILVPGWKYEIQNTSSQSINVKDNAGTVLATLGPTENGFFTLLTNASAAGVWNAWSVYSLPGGLFQSYKVVSTTPFICTQTTDQLITGFSITPAAGSYAVWFNASVFYTATPRGHWWSFYKGGSQIIDSERTQDTAHSNQNMFDAAMTTSFFNGSEACDVRVRNSPTSGQLTVNARSLVLIRLGST